MNTDKQFTAMLTDGTQIQIRPLTSQDTTLEKDFIMRLSPESRRFRFLATLSAPSDEFLKQLTTIKEGSAAAFIAIIKGEKPKEIGVARVCISDPGRAEFALAVSDEWQRRGVGTLLAQCALEAARRMGVHTVFSVEAADNEGMREWAASFGFERAISADDATEVIQTLSLASFDKRHSSVLGTYSRTAALR